MEQLTRSTILAALLFTVPATISAPSYGQSTKTEIAEAHERFERGKELYEENDFVAALMEFRRAYELSPNYKLLYNIGQVYYQMQDYPGALQSFNKYLSEGGNKVSESRRSEVYREIERLRSRVSTLSIVSNKPGVEVFIDDILIGKTPLDKPVAVNPGRRKIYASLPGYHPSTRIIEVAGMEAVRVPLDLTPIAKESETARSKLVFTPAALNTNDRSPYYWSIPAGLAVGGVVLGVLSLKYSDELKTAREGKATPREDLVSMSDKTKRTALIADVLGGLSLVSAGVIGYLYFFNGNDTSTTQITLGPGNVTFSATFH